MYGMGGSHARMTAGAHTQPEVHDTAALPSPSLPCRCVSTAMEDAEAANLMRLINWHVSVCEKSQPTLFAMRHSHTVALRCGLAVSSIVLNSSCSHSPAGQQRKYIRCGKQQQQQPRVLELV